MKEEKLEREALALLNLEQRPKFDEEKAVRLICEEEIARAEREVQNGATIFKFIIYIVNIFQVTNFLIY